MNRVRDIILLVDDSAETLTMFNEALTGAGYTVLVAMDGEQAMQITQRITPDLILLDAIMPKMDGFDTCKALKSNEGYDDVPVIFMTGLGDTQHIVRGFQAGGIDYLQKPINLDELLARIKVHLHNSRITRSTRRALNEISQLAFACDISGRVIWAAQGATEYLSRIGGNGWDGTLFTSQISQWLMHLPGKNSVLKLKGMEHPVQVQFLARSTPDEFIFQVVEDSETRTRDAFKTEFGLTDREAEVLYWIAQGKTNREIAEILAMSPRTVSKHLEAVFRKLGVENRTAATARCMPLSKKR